MLYDGDITDKEMLRMAEEVAENCGICKRFKKAPPKPIVSVPLATQLNESVALDLKEIESSLT